MPIMPVPPGHAATVARLLHEQMTPDAVQELLHRQLIGLIVIVGVVTFLYLSIAVMPSLIDLQRRRKKLA